MLNNKDKFASFASVQGCAYLPGADGDPNSVESGQFAKRQQPSPEIRPGSVPRSQPVKYALPDTFPDAPKNIARAVFVGSPEEEWRYLKDRPSTRRGN